jgi:hypothetical protein
MTMEGKGNGHSGKRDVDGNKEGKGKGKGGKRDGNSDKEGNGDGGKIDDNSNEEGKGKVARGLAMATTVAGDKEGNGQWLW